METVVSQKPILYVRSMARAHDACSSSNSPSNPQYIKDLSLLPTTNLSNKICISSEKSTSTALLCEKPKRRNWGKGCVTVNISVCRMMTMELQRRLAMGFQISKPYLFLTLNELALSVFLVLVESLASSGISTLVIVVYEHVLATIVLSLLSIFFEK